MKRIVNKMQNTRMPERGKKGKGMHEQVIKCGAEMEKE
jgi:hypothetical protein